MTDWGLTFFTLKFQSSRKGIEYGTNMQSLKIVKYNRTVRYPYGSCIRIKYFYKRAYLTAYLQRL